MKTKMKKNRVIIAVSIVLSIVLISCGGASNKSSIAGTYENMGPATGNKFEIKSDGTYIEWECEMDISGIDLQTADPNAEIPMKCKEKSRGKWSLEGTVLHVEVWPYKFGVKPNKLFYNDTMYGKGTIEWTKN
jgi:hypothetical protein